MKKTVYAGMCADILHNGHINILKEASKHGYVIVGLLSDEAISDYKRTPFMSFQQRKEILESLKFVDTVVKQNTLDYTENLVKLKPDYVIHGDDWRQGTQKNTRDNVIDTLKGWNGQLIEIPYTKNISSTILNNVQKKKGTTVEIRRSKLRKNLNLKKMTRIIEAHNGLTGLMVEKASKNNKEFDGMWLSSLTHSTVKGKPDIQYIDITTISQTINEIFDVTTKPMIVDLDNGGKIEHFRFSVKTLERLGVSAVIIEDKVGIKRNSLFEDTSNQRQDDVGSFCHKIKEGKKSTITKDFMIIARIESLILNKGVEDALIRAKKYVESGADGIMIHSKMKKSDEIEHFCKEFRKKDPNTPLIVVPTTYNHIDEEQLHLLGVNLVIYANHLLRSSYPSMLKVMNMILENSRSYECDPFCMPIKEIIKLIPESD